MDLKKQAEKLAKQNEQLKKKEVEKEAVKEVKEEAKEEAKEVKEEVKEEAKEEAKEESDSEVAILKDHVKKLEQEIELMKGKMQAILSLGIARPVETAMVSVGTKENQAEPTLTYTEREPVPITTEFAEVMWAQGVTLNLGNYESARIDVSVKEYCPREKKEELLASLKEFAVKSIRNERLAIEEYRKKRPGQ